ncbi:unnamed protein product [Pedinophyceae sp. YPF-701]|nr:unnamed protein product [Pedinophyceae sp. YPF-701]
MRGGSEWGISSVLCSAIDQYGRAKLHFRQKWGDMLGSRGRVSIPGFALHDGPGAAPPHAAAWGFAPTPRAAKGHTPETNDDVGAASRRFGPSGTGASTALGKTSGRGYSGTGTGAHEGEEAADDAHLGSRRLHTRNRTGKSAAGPRPDPQAEATRVPETKLAARRDAEQEMLRGVRRRVLEQLHRRPSPPPAPAPGEMPTPMRKAHLLEDALSPRTPGSAHAEWDDDSKRWSAAKSKQHTSNASVKATASVGRGAGGGLSSPTQGSPSESAPGARAREIKFQLQQKSTAAAGEAANSQRGGRSSRASASRADQGSPAPGGSLHGDGGEGVAMVTAKVRSIEEEVQKARATLEKLILHPGDSALLRQFRRCLARIRERRKRFRPPRTIQSLKSLARPLPPVEESAESGTSLPLEWEALVWRVLDGPNAVLPKTTSRAERQENRAALRWMIKDSVTELAYVFRACQALPPVPWGKAPRLGASEKERADVTNINRMLEDLEKHSRIPAPEEPPPEVVEESSLVSDSSGLDMFGTGKPAKAKPAERPPPVFADGYKFTTLQLSRDRTPWGDAVSQWQFWRLLQLSEVPGAAPLGDLAVAASPHGPFDAAAAPEVPGGRQARAERKGKASAVPSPPRGAQVDAPAGEPVPGCGSFSKIPGVQVVLLDRRHLGAHDGSARFVTERGSDVPVARARRSAREAEAEAKAPPAEKKERITEFPRLPPPKPETPQATPFRTIVPTKSMPTAPDVLGGLVDEPPTPRKPPVPKMKNSVPACELCALQHEEGGECSFPREACPVSFKGGALDRLATMDFVRVVEAIVRTAACIAQAEGRTGEDATIVANEAAALLVQLQAGAFSAGLLDPTAGKATLVSPPSLIMAPTAASTAAGSPTTKRPAGMAQLPGAALALAQSAVVYWEPALRWMFTFAAWHNRWEPLVKHELLPHIIKTGRAGLRSLDEPSRRHLMPITSAYAVELEGLLEEVAEEGGGSGEVAEVGRAAEKKVEAKKPPRILTMSFNDILNHLVLCDLVGHGGMMLTVRDVSKIFCETTRQPVPVMGLHDENDTRRMVFEEFVEFVLRVSVRMALAGPAASPMDQLQALMRNPVAGLLAPTTRLVAMWQRADAIPRAEQRL